MVLVNERAFESEKMAKKKADKELKYYMGNYTGNAEHDGKMIKFSNIIDTFKKDINADKKISKW